MAFDSRNLRRVVLASAVTTAAVQTVAGTLGLRKGRRDYADIVWGPGLGAIAVVGAAAGNGDAVRRWTMAGVGAAWGARLGGLILDRVRSSDEEDPRYTEYLEDASPAQAVTKVFVTQALAQLLVSAPLQLAAASPLPRSGRRWLFPVGTAVMVAGAVIEATADRQKSAYMARPRDERPQVLDTGLWGISRHPNYMGDSLVWWGSWVASAASAPAAWTLPAPVAMSYFLIYATGAKRTEKRMQDRPGYRDYQQRVAFFYPIPFVKK